RLPRGEAKGGGVAFHLLGKSKLCSRKNADRRCGIPRRSKPSSTRVEVDCPKLVTDLGRPRFDEVETEVTHGRGTPPMSRSPGSLSSSKTGTEFQSRIRSIAGVSSRVGSPSGSSACGGRHHRRRCRQSRNHDNSNRLYDRRRSGQARLSLGPRE